MGFEQYHGPANELSENIRTFARMITSLTEEAEAIGWYKQRMSLEKEQKLQIIQEAEQNGVTQTHRNHNLAHSIFLRWRSQFNKGGAKLLQPRYHKVDP